MIVSLHGEFKTRQNSNEFVILLPSLNERFNSKGSQNKGVKKRSRNEALPVITVQRISLARIADWN